MGKDDQAFGKGLMRGLKRVLFTDDAEDVAPPQETTVRPSQTPEESQPKVVSASGPAPIVSVSAAEPAETKAMTEKVYQLLESRNQQGIDFLEVWKAAKEMGGANAGTLRAAFTSLRIADPKLSRDKLVQSAETYVQQLQEIIRQERTQKQEEKILLEKQREETRDRLDKASRQLETEIAAMQEKLKTVEHERIRLDENFAPRIVEIEGKILSGQQAVDEVIAEIRSVIGLIQTHIN